LANKIEGNSNISDKEADLVYEVADGLAEEFVMKNIEGRTSLSGVLKWTPEKLEQYVLYKIDKLESDINFSYS
jgi:hypothetical protein